MNISPLDRTWRARRPGFTLIELLIVIAIISLLAAILFPVFATVREKARQSACMSNMKQLGMGVLMYYQDCDEWTPRTVYNGGNSYGWAGILYPYVRNTQVYQCPNEEFLLPAPSTGTYGVSYAYNENLRSTNDGVSWSGLAIGSLNSPTATIMIFEWDPFSLATNPPAEAVPLLNPAEASSHCANGVAGGSYFDVMGPMDNANGAGGNYLRHDGGGNYLFLDGHAKFLQSKTVSAGDPATTAKSAQNTGTSNCGGQAYCAEGTGYTGANKHQATFSPV